MLFRSDENDFAICAANIFPVFNFAGIDLSNGLEGELGVDLEVEDETITTFGQMAAFIESKVG